MDKKQEQKKQLFRAIYGAMIDGKYNELSEKEIVETSEKIIKHFKKNYNVK